MRAERIHSPAASDLAEAESAIADGLIRDVGEVVETWLTPVQIQANARVIAAAAVAPWRQMLPAAGDNARQPNSHAEAASVLDPLVPRGLFRFAGSAGAGWLAAKLMRWPTGPAEPVVVVEATSQVPESSADLHALAEDLAGQFGYPGPIDVSFEVGLRPQERSKRGLPAIPHENLLGWRFYGLPLARLRKLPPPTGAERMVLRATRDIDFYPLYAEAYAAFHRERPELSSYVRVERPADLQEFIHIGHVFEIFVDPGWDMGLREDAAWAGLVGATRQRLLGMHGYAIVEEILAPRFRGQGLAKVLQWHLFQQLPPGGGPVVFGAIHRQNPWSVKTAEASGRVPAGVRLVVPVPARSSPRGGSGSVMT